MNPNDIFFLFLKSAFRTKGTFGGIQKIVDWLKVQNDHVHVKIDKIPFAAMKLWFYDETSGTLRHQTGKFFSINGIRIKTNWGRIHDWEQPIINQPEIGYLGFITKEFDGVLHFLMQAKIEPGNLNSVQLSPTLQATRSNYSQVHQGKAPLYLEYFQKAKPHQIILDQLQSEQGARFLKKRNRNIIIKLDEDIHVHDNFVWATLAEIKKLIQYDNLVNMDTRTVISGIPFGTFDDDVVDFFSFLGCNNFSKPLKKAFLKSALSGNGALHSIEEIITFLTQLKSIYDLEVTKVPLQNVKDWIFDESEICHQESKFFGTITKKKAAL